MLKAFKNCLFRVTWKTNFTSGHLVAWLACCKIELQPLQDRRKELRLVLLYKIAEGLLPAIPPDPHLTPCRPKRKIRARTFGDFFASNPVTRHQRVNDRCFEVPQSMNHPPRSIKTHSSLEPSLTGTSWTTTQSQPPLLRLSNLGWNTLSLKPLRTPQIKSDKMTEIG